MSTDPQISSTAEGESQVAKSLLYVALGGLAVVSLLKLFSKLDERRQEKLVRQAAGESEYERKHPLRH